MEWMIQIAVFEAFFSHLFSKNRRTVSPNLSPLPLQGPAALLQSYQEYVKLVTLTVEDYVADWEEGNHSLEESDAEILRLSNVSGQRLEGGRMFAPLSVDQSGDQKAGHYLLHTTLFPF